MHSLSRFFSDAGGLLPVWTWAAVAFVFIIAGSCAAALLFPRCSRRLTGFSRSGLALLSRYPLAVLPVPGIVFGAIVLLWLRGFPLPHIHDEFSYLLAADTFAHGRLANPAHPLWQSFETFHVNQQPVYVSMYLPGWGLVLAAGQVVVGHPWFAVWVSALLMVLATYWSARGWLPKPWAMAAALSASGLVAGGYWLTSYWGGSLAAAGGALALGSWPRIVKGHRSGASALGAGAVILLLTRPWEGCALVAVVGAALLLRRQWRASLTVLLIVGPALGWLGFYNWRTTGSPLRPAYVDNFEQYHHRRVFVFQHDRETPPEYRHEVMRRLYFESLRLDPFSGKNVAERLIPTFTFYGGHLLLFALAAIPWLVRDPRMRVLLAAIAAVWVAVLLTVWVRPHYLAPAAAGIMIVAMRALRLVGTLRWRGKRAGRLVAFAALGAWLLMRGSIGIIRLGEDASPPAWVAKRAEIEARLASSPHKHLVLVRYDKSHDPDEEWVYNGADLAGTKVIWARAMNETADEALRRCYSDRVVSLLDVGPGPYFFLNTK